MNIFHLLEGAARRFGERPACFVGDECVATYGELHSRARRLAGGLQKIAEPGARIALVSKNCPEFLEIMFGAWAAGMVIAPINAKLHASEIAAICEDAEVSLILASHAIAQGLKTSLPQSAPVCTIGSADYERLFANHPMLPEDVAPDDLAWLFYTSGTTGRSKGAMLSHRNLLAMTTSHLADFEDLSEDHAIIHAAPMSHGSGLYILPYIARGCAQVVPRSAGFDPGEFLDLCDVHPGSGAFLAPTMVQWLRLEAERRGSVPAGLRSVIYGGGPMYIEEIKKALACFGPIFRQLYGQGECPMTITGLRQRDFEDRSDDLLGSVGWPRSGIEVRIVDERGRELPAGEAGEIQCRGDVVMQGYWKNSEATASSLRDGWLSTGDIGEKDQKGRLTLRDRSKEVIISGGTNIYPREIEEVLLRHASIEAVAVIGRPDEEWGESVVAIIQPASGASVDLRELDQLCQSCIARFKRPKFYGVIASLPKSSYGKILKREIVAMMEQNQIALSTPG